MFFNSATEPNLSRKTRQSVWHQWLRKVITNSKLSNTFCFTRQLLHTPCYITIFFTEICSVYFWWQLCGNTEMNDYKVYKPLEVLESVVIPQQIWQIYGKFSYFFITTNVNICPFQKTQHISDMYIWANKHIFCFLLRPRCFKQCFITFY